MRVLNLDLDFFLNERAHGRKDDPNSRPDNWGLVPWKADAVVEFIENALNLRTKVPGAVVVSHHEVFYHWRDLIERGALNTPFFACHVDAHSDLGCGTPAWVYLHSDFLELSLAARRYPMEGDEGLNFANFMAFAIGNRWFSAIDFVVPSFWRNDFPIPMFPSSEVLKPNRELQIELLHAPREQIEACVSEGRRRVTSILKSRNEPKIPLHLLAHDSVRGRYDGQNWDYVFLSHSPGYVPTAADALLPVISAYIDSKSMAPAPSEMHL